MNDAGDAGDFESLLDALPPSPEPPNEIPEQQQQQHQLATETVRRKSTNIHSAGSNSRICELCGFEPKTKNKSRERMDHLAMKHFREQMISELRKDKPMKCPRCDGFESKDRQQLFRHMISKHKVLDHYLVDAIEKMRSEGKQPFGAAANPPVTTSSLTITPAVVPTISIPAVAAATPSATTIVVKPSNEPMASTS